MASAKIPSYPPGRMRAAPVAAAVVGDDRELVGEHVREPLEHSAVAACAHDQRSGGRWMRPFGGRTVFVGERIRYERTLTWPSSRSPLLTVRRSQTRCGSISSFWT